MRRYLFGLATCLVVTLGIISCPLPLHAAEVQVLDDFEAGLSKAWKPKAFVGTTAYNVVAEGNGHVLQATSIQSASGLIFEQEFDPHDWPVLSWRWKIAHTLAKGDARFKSGDDYAARVYVIFPHWFFLNTKSLNYIWANRLPVGELVPNPFTGKAMMLAVESGPAKVGEWLVERRNIADDYRRAFGGSLPSRAVIAIMSDSDNTGGSVTAWYDDIRLENPGK